MSFAGASGAEPWIDICALSDIVPSSGVCARVGARQIAIFHLPEGSAGGASVYAISNFDPFSKAFVLSRGIVGDRGGAPKVASPMFKHNFDLSTGKCLDDESVSVPTYPVRVRAGRVELQAPPASRS